MQPGVQDELRRSLEMLLGERPQLAWRLLEAILAEPTPEAFQIVVTVTRTPAMSAAGADAATVDQLDGG